MSDEISRFFATLEGRRAEEAPVLDVLFQRVSGFAPMLHSGRVVGYGHYDYRYASGQTGTCWATGFALSKAKIALHIMPGYTDFSEICQRLGKHSAGKSCYYINKLGDIDLEVLEELVSAGLADLKSQWKVRA